MESNSNSSPVKPIVELLVEDPKELFELWSEGKPIRISGRHLVTNSRGKSFSSSIEFHSPLSFVFENGTYAAESRNTTYHLVKDPEYDPKQVYTRQYHRYLAGLEDVKIRDSDYEKILTGFDRDANSKILARLDSETDDYWEVYILDGKRNGSIRYLK